MSRRRAAQAIVAIVAVAWLAVGGLGARAYTHDYSVYRGFAPPRDPAGLPVGRILHKRFFSPALNAWRRFTVYEPPGYRSIAQHGRRLPVLYLLHGSPGSPLMYINAGAVGVEVDKLVAAGQIPPFLVVMPDGRDGSFKSDTEWADTPRGRYASFVLDVVHAVDGMFPTLASPRHRAIAGYSEGAYGAINIALSHLGVFRTAESWSGYFNQQRAGPFATATRAQLVAASPYVYTRRMVRTIRRARPHLYLYAGSLDHERHPIPHFATQLRAEGAVVRTSLWPGRHDWGLWRRHVPDMLRYAGQQLGGVRRHRVLPAALERQALLRQQRADRARRLRQQRRATQHP